MRKSVTQKQVLHALVNKLPGETTKSIALKLGLTPDALYMRISRMGAKIAAYIPKVAQQRAGIYLAFLERNAEAGDTKAAQILLEMAGAYTPSQQIKQDVNVRQDLGVIMYPAKQVLLKPGQDDAARQIPGNGAAMSISDEPGPDQDEAEGQAQAGGEAASVLKGTREPIEEAAPGEAGVP